MDEFLRSIHDAGINVRTFHCLHPPPVRLTCFSLRCVLFLSAYRVCSVVARRLRSAVPAPRASETSPAAQSKELRDDTAHRYATRRSICFALLPFGALMMHRRDDCAIREGGADAARARESADLEAGPPGPLQGVHLPPRSLSLSFEVFCYFVSSDAALRK